MKPKITPQAAAMIANQEYRIPRYKEYKDGYEDGLADALFVNDQLFQPIMIYRMEGKKPGKLIVEVEQ